jgi:predicted TPR repeat methyltransferase
MTDPITDRCFEQAKASFFAGLKCFQAGEFVKAEQHYLASLHAVPGRASTLINLAAAQLELLKPADALATADAALAVEPDSIDGLLHRATALLELARFADALGSFDRLVAIDGSVAEAWVRRAKVLERLGRPMETLASYARALEIDPEHADAWSGQGSLMREMGRLEEAARSFKEALRQGADPEIHAYYLSSVDALCSPPTAPRKYVQALFDDYANEFDEHLVGALHYGAHKRLSGVLSASFHGPYASALDLGCGTGLCGPLIRPMVEQLSCVDVSSKMLEKARTLGVYDRLVQADVVEYLQNTAERFDLLVAADVFIYLGDLAPIFSVARRLMREGVFCFSIELLADARRDFTLLPSLRFAHSETYVRRLSSESGFRILSLERGQIRKDQQTPVEGLFVFLGA